MQTLYYGMNAEAQHSKPTIEMIDVGRALEGEVGEMLSVSPPKESISKPPSATAVYCSGQQFIVPP